MHRSTPCPSCNQPVPGTGSRLTSFGGTSWRLRTAPLSLNLCALWEYWRLNRHLKNGLHFRLQCPERGTRRSNNTHCSSGVSFPRAVSAAVMLVHQRIRRSERIRGKVADCDVSCLLDERRPESLICSKSQASKVTNILTPSSHSCTLPQALLDRCGGCIPHVTPWEGTCYLPPSTLPLRGLSSFGSSQLFLNSNSC